MTKSNRTPIPRSAHLRRALTDRRVVLTALAVAMLAGWGIILAPATYGGVVFVVCAFFTVLFFGLAGLNVALLRNGTEERDVLRHGEGDSESVHIFTGELPRKDARVQLLIVPASVGIGFFALALVELFDRLTA